MSATILENVEITEELKKNYLLNYSEFLRREYKMERTFFGESIEIQNTYGNQVLSDVLTEIENKLIKIFKTPLKTSFLNWKTEAIKNKPNLKYLLEWLEKDSNFTEIYLWELPETLSYRMSDEFNQVRMILDSLDDCRDDDVLASDFAEMIYYFSKTLVQEIIENKENKRTD